MNCPRCGRPMNDRDSFCNNCGAQVQPQTAPAYQPPAPWQPKKSNKTLMIIAAVVVAVIVVGAAAAALAGGGGLGSGSTSNKATYNYGLYKMSVCPVNYTLDPGYSCMVVNIVVENNGTKVVSTGDPAWQFVVNGIPQYRFDPTYRSSLQGDNPWLLYNSGKASFTLFYKVENSTSTGTLVYNPEVGFPLQQNYKNGDISYNQKIALPNYASSLGTPTPITANGTNFVHYPPYYAGLSWTEVQGAMYYEIQIAEETPANSNQWHSLGVFFSDTNSVSIKIDVINDHQWRVRACTAWDTVVSPWSEIRTFT